MEATQEGMLEKKSLGECSDGGVNEGKARERVTRSRSLKSRVLGVKTSRTC